MVSSSARCFIIRLIAYSRSASVASPSSSVRRQNARSLSDPRRNDSTTGSVILPSRKSSPVFLPGLAAVIEGVIHELEGDTEIHPERAAGVLLVFGPSGERWTHLARGGEELRGLGANDGEVVVLGGGGVLGGAELHHLAFGDDRGG